ncbi:MAG: hypothetical protein JXB04_12930 [Kiritimatiellae bacterium]|nr:hypothetical protein [Kiritimatiellia bacterium]
MKRWAIFLIMAAMVLILSGCGEPPPEIHNYRVEFAGTQGLKARGYWTMYGGRNEFGTTEEFMITVPDTLLFQGIGLQTFVARKLEGEGTLYVDIYKDSERVLEEWTSADMDEIRYEEPDPIRR